MAEARAEEDEENMRRENREQVVRRQPGGRPDRRKPEHRHSQGPLSSIRAAIKRTSTRPASVSESARDRERDRDRERRRPEITILSAEPLASTSWFAGASGGFPPPPPPAAQIWGATIPPSVPPTIQPPPSYEEVIREKTQEQVVLRASSSSASSPSSTITIATQTDAGPAPGPAPGPPESPVRRPVRPPRPPLASPSRPPPHIDDITSDQPPPPQPRSETVSTPCCDLLGDLWDPPPANPVPPERPRPRPRTKLGVRPSGGEVRVQTLVKLREDGAATLAATAAAADHSGSDTRQGRYLQELLEAFSADDWGFPDRHGDSSGLSQSESEEEEEEEEEEEDMATLRARIQAFEQQAADGSCAVVENPPNNPSAKPEPRPRPRLQGQPARSAPPAIAPKPKNLPSAARPSSKASWEDGGKPPVTPKPQLALEAPVPAPRPPPPKLTTPGTDSASNPRPPPRPSVTPRASALTSPQERSTSDGRTTPSLPPRPSVEVCTAAAAAAATGSDASPTVKAGSVRPDVPAKTSSPRRASAPNVAAKPAAVCSTPPEDPEDWTKAPGPATPPTTTATPPTTTATPPTAATPPTTATPPPAPASRRTASRSQAPNTENHPDTAPPARSSGVKLLPLRPPPIKSNPLRPPPPALSSAPSTKPADAPPVPRVSLPRSSPSPVAANQKAQKKGPPLPPRPQPGHPLYNATKQEVLIVLDDPSPAPSPAPCDHVPSTKRSESLLDPEPRPEPGVDTPDSQSILPEQKEQPTPPTVGGKEEELTVSRGDVITLLELVDRGWGRGTEEAEEPTGQSLDSTAAPNTPPVSDSEEAEPWEKEAEPCVKEAEEWDVALFDFPGQTAEDLSFPQGALIQVTEHVDAHWRRGLLDGREGLYPAAFTRPCRAQPIRGQQTEAQPIRGQQTEAQPIRGQQAKAVFDFTAENDDELNLKVGDIITEVESVDEQWIVGVVGGKRGIVPKNYVSLA